MNDKEHIIRVPLDEYKELIEARTRLDDLIDFIFNNCDYIDLTKSLEIDEHKLNNYLKSIWTYHYNKTIEKLKKKSD